MNMDYDLIIIGGGPAGYLAAERAGNAGLGTLLIEKRFIGGVCLNEGCIPTKTLLYSAKLYDSIKHGEKYGVKAAEVSFDHKTILSRKNCIVKMLVSGIRSKLKKSGVVVEEGSGFISGRNSEGFIIIVNGKEISSKRLLIATGSEPVIPPIPGICEGIENGFIMSNREILNLKELPSSLAIIGGGVIGLEMASYFNSAGCKVTVIEMLDHIAGNTDREISDILQKNHTKKGIDFKLNSKVTGIGTSRVVFENGGVSTTLEVDKALVSVGRKPVTAGIGLENIGVELENGRIKIDRHCLTNIPEVYAAGDVTGNLMLAHTAYREAEICINNMLGRRDIARYNAIPSVIYTNPEVACAGETEESARLKGIDFETKKISMMYSGRYAAETDTGDGICKVLIDKRFNNIIGVHMIGSYASEIIYGACLMIETELRVEDIKELVFPHPTVSEIIRECLFS